MKVPLSRWVDNGISIKSNSGAVDFIRGHYDSGGDCRQKTYRAQRSVLKGNCVLVKGTAQKLGSLRP